MIAVRRPTLRAVAERRLGVRVLSSTIDVYSLCERGAAQMGDDQDGPVLAYPRPVWADRLGLGHYPLATDGLP